MTPFKLPLFLGRHVREAIGTALLIDPSSNVQWPWSIWVFDPCGNCCEKLHL